MKYVISILLVAALLCSCTVLPGSPTISNTVANVPSDTSIHTDPSITTLPPTTAPVTVPPTQAPTPDSLEAMITSMTIEERVGQLFLARCPDTNAITDIETYHLGGFVLFGRDFQYETPSSVAATIAAYQSASKIPMLIAVDEEGGNVNRVSRYPAFRDTPFSSPRSLYNKGGLDLVFSTEAEKCQLLLSLGINVNLAPVCDVTTNPDSFMYPRSLGQTPEITGEFIAGMLNVMAQYGIGSTLKHFPGYGNNTDTHVGIALDDRPLSFLESEDLIPFQSGIDAGCDAIMVSHIIIQAMDCQYPATLSPAVHTYLRQNMGFDGVIVSDDLAMQAITDTYGAEEAAVLAVLAGNDLLCVTDYKTQYNAVLQAVLDNRISEDVLNTAVRRILRWKANLGLII